MDIISIVAEEKIKKARDDGDLDDLPGAGKPLELEDLSRVPEDLRSSYIMLRNAGVLPEEVQLKKEMINLERLIGCCYRDSERENLQGKLNELQVRFNLLAEKRNLKREVRYNYEAKIFNRLGRK